MGGCIPTKADHGAGSSLLSALSCSQCCRCPMWSLTVFACFLSLPASLQGLSPSFFSVLVICHHQWHLDLFLFHPLPCLPLRSESQKGCFSQSLNVGVCTPQHRQIRRKIQQTAVWQFEIKRGVLLWVLIKKLFFVSKKYICIYSSYKILFYKYEVQLVSCIHYGKRRWL